MRGTQRLPLRLGQLRLFGNGDTVQPCGLRHDHARSCICDMPTCVSTCLSLHPIVRQQVSARQPGMLVILVLWCTPTLLLPEVAKLLMRWRPFADFCTDHGEAYLTTFFLLQTTLIISAVGVFSVRHASALWRPRPAFWWALATSIALSLPVLLWQLFFAVRATTAFLGWLAPTDDLRLQQVHEAFWASLEYGCSLEGVVYSSVVKMVGPILEEVVFTGFLANRIVARCGGLVAVIAVPLMFTLMHLPKFGLGLHLLSMLLAGATLICVRFLSGSLMLSVVMHLFLNAIVMLPRWIEAYVFFYCQNR